MRLHLAAAGLLLVSAAADAAEIQFIEPTHEVWFGAGPMREISEDHCNVRLAGVISEGDVRLLQAALEFLRERDGSLRQVLCLESPVRSLKGFGSQNCYLSGRSPLWCLLVGNACLPVRLPLWVAQGLTEIYRIS